MIKRWMIWVVGILIGAVAGYLYWYYVGCVSGSCAITSSPINSTLYGAVMGGLLVNTFNYKRKETEDKKELK
jgi:phage shock protein E